MRRYLGSVFWPWWLFAVGGSRGGVAGALAGGLHGLRVSGFGFIEVGVEGHGDIAQEVLAGLGDGNGLVCHGDEAVVFKGFERGEGVGEVVGEWDIELFGEGIELDFKVAHEVHNRGASDVVIRGQHVAAGNGESIVIDGGVVSGDIFFVLAVGMGCL